MVLISRQEKDDETRHSDEVRDIITAVPSWILLWGITFFFIVLVLLGVLSAFIKYPEMVKATLKIDSRNTPKPVVANVAGKVLEILVRENDHVITGQSLAFIESTADHKVVIKLLGDLRLLHRSLKQFPNVTDANLFSVDSMHLGELQIGYQSFLRRYSLYKLSLEKRQCLKTTSAGITSEENKYPTKKRPIVRTDSSLVTTKTNYFTNEKQFIKANYELKVRASFLKALNRMIGQTEDWKNKYVLTASAAGKLRFAGIIHQNQLLVANQNVFYIDPANKQFFGEMLICENDKGKVKGGQHVLIKLRSYPFEEYGMLRGTIKCVTNTPDKGHLFSSIVNINVTNSTDQNKPIHVRSGMMADAEIITQNATIFQMLSRNVIGAMAHK
ncbi:hypothetical protein ACVW0P_000657 [Mucilaginibacter sp. UYNi724]